MTHRTQARAQWLEQDALRRQELYKEFVEAAARCYVHALQHEEADIPGLVNLYAKIDRMRILSSANVLEIAELRDMINSGSVNVMREFSTACREEVKMQRIL